MMSNFELATLISLIIGFIAVVLAILHTSSSNK